MGLLECVAGPCFYEAPAGTNANLRAQSGLFSFVVHAADDAPIEVCNTLRETPLRLRRLNLPVREAPKLLRLLSYEGITGASMFPGTDGVVRSMSEISRWDKRSD